MMKTHEEIIAINLALTDIETTCGHCPYEGEPNGCNRPGGTCKMFDVALDAAEAIQQIEAQQPCWISVKDRLPTKNDVCVLCHCDTTGAVTHWMPLPEPPKEERHD